MTGGGWLRRPPEEPQPEAAQGAAQVAPGPPNPGPVGVGGAGAYGAPGGALAPAQPAQWEDPAQPERRTLRSTEWDGPCPQVGDLVALGSLSVVRRVARGAGAGQWRLDVELLDAGDEVLITRRTVWQWRADPG